MYQVGDIFLDKYDIDRMSRQAFHEDLYLSRHIYDKKIKTIDPKTGQVGSVKLSQLLPLPQTISETWSDLLFMEFPQMTFESDEADAKLKEIQDRLQIDLLEAAATNSAIGMLWWVLYRVDGKGYWKFVQPQHTKWIRDKIGQLINFQIIEEMPQETPSDAKKTFKVIEHTYEANEQGEIIETEKGRIHVVNEYILIVNKDKDGEWKVTSRQDIDSDRTDLNFIPAIECPNMAMLGSEAGRSDYEGKEQIFQEIDNRYAQINHVINENADPWVLMPAGVLDESGNFRRQNGKMIEKAGTGSADNNIELVTWDGQLSAAFDAIKSMMKQLFFTCRLSPSIVGLETETGGQSDSGRALKWRSINTLTALGKRRLYWNSNFKKFFDMLSYVDTDYQVFRDKNLIIRWQDGLPADTTEKTQNIVAQVNAGIKSRETAIRQLNEVGKEDALEEIERIDSDAQKQAEIDQSALPSIQV